MRHHCLTQHGYDPNPEVRNNPKSPALQKGHDISLGVRRKLQGKISESLKLQELAIGRSVKPGTKRKINSVDSAIDYLLDNYVLVRKRRIQGISGHVCKHCLTFHFKYISDIGDPMAGERHVCSPHLLKKAKSLQNGYSVEAQLRADSVYWLVQLSKSLFGSNLEAVVQSISPKTFDLIRYHFPLIECYFLSESDWSWPFFTKGRLVLDEKGLETIIENVGGTFAVFSIDAGKFRGYHLLKITRPSILL
jgi:hypothetical protein